MNNKEFEKFSFLKGERFGVFIISNDINVIPIQSVKDLQDDDDKNESMDKEESTIEKKDENKLSGKKRNRESEDSYSAQKTNEGTEKKMKLSNEAKPRKLFNNISVIPNICKSSKSSFTKFEIKKNEI